MSVPTTGKQLPHRVPCTDHAKAPYSLVDPVPWIAGKHWVRRTLLGVLATQIKLPSRSTRCSYGRTVLPGVRDRVKAGYLRFLMSLTDRG